MKKKDFFYHNIQSLKYYSIAVEQLGTLIQHKNALQ